MSVLKDILLITPYLFAITLMLFVHILVYLVLLFGSSLIFIYEEIKYVKKTR